jgi:hypothetical protein
MSPRLIALLRHYKQSQSFTDWRQIALVLGDLYHTEMSLDAVVHHVVAAYEEARSEPRFQITSESYSFEKILMAPLNDTLAINSNSTVSFSTQLTIEFVYNSLIRKIINVLTYGTNIGWCRDVLFFDESSSDQS